MAYIGKTPVVGNFQVCDAISVVNGQAAYTLQVGGANVIPESANHMLVSLNGILQKPGSSFTISGSTMTFASNLATGDVIDFVLLLGDVLDIGAPSDATVTNAKLVSGSFGNITSTGTLTNFTSTGIDDNADATAITIDSSERVGIGTTSPSNSLEITGSGTPININSTNDEVKKIQFENSGVVQGYYGCSSGTPMRILDGSASELMRIDSAGQTSIGTTTTNAQLFVESDNDSISTFRLNDTSSGSGGKNIAIFQRRATNVGFISVTDSATSFVTSSDHRLKENVNYTFDATTRLKQLKPARFNFIVDADKTVDGFLAHEVSSIVPEAITGEKDAMKTEEYEVTPAVLDENGNVITEAVMGTREVPEYQGIDQSKLVPLLVKTIQELEARITALESK